MIVCPGNVGHGLFASLCAGFISNRYLLRVHLPGSRGPGSKKVTDILFHHDEVNMIYIEGLDRLPHRGIQKVRTVISLTRVLVQNGKQPQTELGYDTISGEKYQVSAFHFRGKS